MNPVARRLMTIFLSIGSATCGGDTLTQNEREAAECAEIVDGLWEGELDGATLSVRLTLPGVLGCFKGSGPPFNQINASWSWKGFEGDPLSSGGVFVYRPESPEADSISVHLVPSSGCSRFADSRLEASFGGPDRLEGTVTLWLSEADSVGVCSEPPLVDLRNVPVQLLRTAEG